MVTWEEFSETCGFQGAASAGPPNQPKGFDLEGNGPYRCLWSANDGQDETRYVALLVDRDGLCWRVSGSHDNTGWDCHGDWYIEGPYTRPRGWASITTEERGWDLDGFERARSADE